jgi:aspartate aminotransferase
MKLADRVSKIRPSATHAMSIKAKQLQAQGVDVIDFGLGEPDFDTPREIKKAAIEAIRKGFTKYTSPSGTDELKLAVLEKFRRENGLEYEKDQVVISCGAKHTLYNLAQVLFDQGDEVIIPAPYWVSYPDQVLINGATPVIVPTEESNVFRLTLEALRSRITSRTKALILNSPGNPTGAAYEKKHLEEIAQVVLEKNLLVISDEIYERMVYNGFKHVSFASLSKEVKDRTVVVNGVSKTFSMTGWRIGYAAGPKPIMSAMANLQSQSTSNPCSISQKAAVAALSLTSPETIKMLGEFDRRRTYLLKRLSRIKGITCVPPLGAFYAFPKVSSYFGKTWKDRTISNSQDLANYLLEEAGVAVVAGDSFGADSYVRISYATAMKRIRKGLDLMHEALKKLS